MAYGGVPPEIFTGAVLPTPTLTVPTLNINCGGGGGGGGGTGSPKSLQVQAVMPKRIMNDTDRMLCI
jgi:hypothetical protein